MNLSQLEVLVAIVDAGSLTEAAEQVGLTQSAVSHSLNRLEADLGVTLLERGRGGITVTRIGEEVVSHARATLAQIEVIRQKTARARGTAIGKLRFGCIPNIAPRLLTGILRDFQYKYPEVDVILFEGKPVELMSWLNEGIVDVATVLLPAAFDVTVSLARDEIHVLVAETHPLARRRAVHMNELHDEALIAPQDQYRLIASVPSLQEVKLPRLRYAVSAYHTIFGMVRENMGISLVPGKLVSPEVDGLVVVPVEPKLQVDVYLGVRVATPATDVFLANAHEWALAEGFLPADM